MIALKIGRKPHIWVACVLLVFVSGCGGVPTGSVSGSASIDGAPVPAGRIVFTSSENTCSGTIADGEYNLAHNGSPNIPVGEYIVTVFPPRNEEKFNPDTNKIEFVDLGVDPKIFPKKYQVKSTSDLKFTSKAGENRLDIELSNEG